MDGWAQLSMSEKSELMSLYIKNGISSLEEIKKRYNNFATGGGLDEPDNPLNKYASLVRTPQVAVADNTRYTAPITDVDIDRVQGLPRGTTTLRREIATKTNPVISQNITPEEAQNQINRAVKTQKVLEPLNQALDVVEELPVVGDAITVGRAASDAIYGDYTAASLLPLMWLGNKLPFGKTGVKQAAKLAENEGRLVLTHGITTPKLRQVITNQNQSVIPSLGLSRYNRVGDYASNNYAVDLSGKEGGLTLFFPNTLLNEYPIRATRLESGTPMYANYKYLSLQDILQQKQKWFEQNPSQYSLKDIIDFRRNNSIGHSEISPIGIVPLTKARYAKLNTEFGSKVPDDILMWLKDNNISTDVDKMVLDPEMVF